MGILTTGGITAAQQTISRGDRVETYAGVGLDDEERPMGDRIRQHRPSDEEEDEGTSISHLVMIPRGPKVLR